MDAVYACRKALNTVCIRLAYSAVKNVSRSGKGIEMTEKQIRCKASFLEGIRFGLEWARNQDGTGVNDGVFTFAGKPVTFREDVAEAIKAEVKKFTDKKIQELTQQ